MQITFGVRGRARPDRARARLLPLLAADAAGAALLTLEQITKHRALCASCLGAAPASAAALSLALPGGTRARSTLRDRG